MNIVTDAPGRSTASCGRLSATGSRGSGGGVKGFTTQELGPVRWEAPESLERREYSEASDAYALGCVLHELSRRRPGRRAGAAAVAHAVLSGKRPAPWACSPPALAFWRRRCFEARPADRPAVAARAYVANQAPPRHERFFYLSHDLAELRWEGHDGEARKEKHVDLEAVDGARLRAAATTATATASA
ncbi:protein kinase [Aureococcus anophagefferens]|nr:protein kinase [Aureococcus anophagefferens]